MAPALYVFVLFQLRFSSSAGFFLALFIFIIYSNTFTAPWELDDLPNIINNAPVHIDNLMPETIRQTLFARPFAEGQLYRPVVMLSFALNWYVGQENPLGYHIVNVLIHILTAFFLCQAIFLVFQTPVLKKYSRDDALFVALLGTALWAANPIQIQAVTYIVQRMTSLAAMWYVWAMICYLKARFARTPSQRAVQLLFCLLCYICAVGSKENAVLLPIGLLLLDVTFFTGRQDRFGRNLRLFLYGVSALIVVFALYYLVHNHYLTQLFDHSGTRAFSLYERLLTEPRIVFFYLSLIFYPLPARFSIDHDIIFSTSLLQPWTTLPALLGIAFLVIMGFSQLRKRPLLAFALIFFFINHLIESTIIPLELIFEHRNYLPSLFLFVPVALWLRQGLKKYSSRSSLVFGTILIFIPLLLVQFGWGTYLRNNLWASRESLWLDASHKSTGRARAQSYLGQLFGFYQKKPSPENMEKGLAHLRKALTGGVARRNARAATWGNIGGIYFNYGIFDKSIENYEKSLAMDPNFNKFRFHLAEAYTMQGEFTKALEQTKIILTKQEPSNAVYNLRGLIFLWMDQPDKAIKAVRIAMLLSGPHPEQSFCNMGAALSHAGYYNQANWFLKNALKNSPRDNIILFSLIENNVRAGNTEEALRYGRRVYRSYPLTLILQSLDHLKNDHRTTPVDVELIRPIIEKVGRELIQPES